MSDSDVKIIEKKINSELRKAQSSMFSGKNEEAWNITEGIWIDIERLKSSDPNNRSITSLEHQYTRLKQDLEKKLKKGVSAETITVITSTPPKISPIQLNSQASTGPTKIIEVKLPGGVVKRLEEIENRLQQAENLLNQAENSSISDRAIRQIESAKSTYEELERMYEEQTGHPEVLRIKEKILVLTNKLDAISDKLESSKTESREIKSKIENHSQEWLERLMPYTSGGVLTDKLELSRIRGRDNLLRQKNLLTELKNLLREYQDSDWSLGRTSELETVEKELEFKVNMGQSTYDQSVKSILDEAESIIDEKLIELKNDGAWRTDTSLRPSWLLKRDRETLDEKMGLVKELVPDIIPHNLPALTVLENKHRELEKENQERLTVLPKRTFMAPPKYNGDDSELLKIKAGQLVKENEPEADILRVHLIGGDWRVEDVIEHTDTSRTALQRRVTYHLPAQVAARVSGKILLYNAYIAKNQHPDGSFGNLYGNLEDYPQQISTENIPD